MDIKDEKDEELVNYSLGGDDYSNAAQIEMMRRLKNAIENLDKNTKNYSGKLIDLTILLFFIALIQVVISIMGVPGTWFTQFLMLGTVMYAIYYVIRRLAEKYKNNQNLIK